MKVRETRLDRRTFLRRATVTGAAALGALHVSETVAATDRPVRVRVWCEGSARKAVYPSDIDGAIAEYLGRKNELNVSRSRLGDSEAGLSDGDLDATDVLIWWGRLRHDDVPADRVDAVVERVKSGKLGFLALHASCASKPFRALMGTACEPGGWREDGEPEHIQVRAPDHPIARGVAPFTIPKTDMFTEPFSVPNPETVVLLSSWDHGETMRSGLTWTIGKGRVVYLRPGHDAFPVLFHPALRQVVANSVLWAAKRT
ncbi:ThuA domain-containing protein [Singulisphaera sp. PoT]|uniref:ThuA domain-containing protein n=1 Tax=Singulisphaera sp. PoT TaxID=3411797 RepID=UPI003BF5A3DE